MNVAIIGCGLIGQKRAKTLGDHNLVLCVDQISERAHALAQQHSGCEVHTDWQVAVNRADVDVIIISTLHATLADMTHAAVRAGKHVLVEKPAARCAEELDAVIETAQKNNALVRVGFNHRYHRAFRKARELVDQNALGELMFVRARYGHGGRIGYDKEWRAQPELSGGGELIDQGVHLIDLARWFLGDFNDVQGFAHTYYWDMPVDDNGFLLLKTPQHKVALLHASCTEWKNLFSFELYGRDGKIEVNGLGGSYGLERLTYYKMLPEMGPPETYAWEYPMADDSWAFEMQEFFADIQAQRQPEVGLHDAREALIIVGKIYRMSKNDNCS
ncbi:MAG: Gfo/Idh/MocA family oxidoreductase [Legionellales bacterium]|nr:Gfo/Idh/MocA family oxidoreductase [Legionellales bacterium]